MGRVEVDFVVRAVQAETDRALGVAAVEVVYINGQWF
jgi:hypothetical protein